MESQQQGSWLDVVFDRDDHTCYTDVPKGKESTAVRLAASGLDNREQYMCINALDGFRDRKPVDVWHSADVPRRADVNVVKFRTFLVEFDSRAIEDQLDYVIEQCKMPYSVATFSGGKSVHFLICLEQPLASLHDYRSVVHRLYVALGGKAVGLDEQNKNPSRLTRTPNGLRKPNGPIQALLDVQGRVPLATLESWLTSRGFSKEDYDDMVAKRLASKAAVAKLRELQRMGGNFKGPLSTQTKNFLMLGAKPGEWNISFFKAACDMARCGYTEDEVLAKLEQSFGHLEPVTIRTVQSAVLRALEEG